VQPFQQYAAEGYYVARRAIPEALVRRLAARFLDDAKRCSDPQLRQNGSEEPNRFDRYGFMKAPLCQPHQGTNAKLAEFRAAILDLACSAEMLEALALITLRPRHVLQQIMMFEQSATPPHQDWVYLDSFPSGCLTAAWVALEDISPEATRFFVVPGSQAFDCDFPHDWIWNSSRYTDAVAEAVRNQFADRVTMPEMRAGDVLFWNSRLIHGSRAGTDPSRSRLSLAAHYIPEGFGYGNRGTPVWQAYPFPVVTGRPIPYTSPRIQPPETSKSGWVQKGIQRIKKFGVIRGLLGRKAGVSG
jgi:phytanoyl-CoA hydroxylase